MRHSTLYPVLGLSVMAAIMFATGLHHTKTVFAKSPIAFAQAKLDMSAKIGATYSLDNATFDEAIKAMKALPGCKDLNFTASSPKSSDLRVTFQLGPDTTVEQLLGQIASLYGRATRIEGGVVRFVPRDNVETLISEATAPYTVLSPETTKELDNRVKALAPEAMNLQDDTALEQKLEKLAKELEEQAQAGEKIDTKAIQETARKMAELAKELAKKSGNFRFNYTVPKMDPNTMKLWEQQGKDGKPFIYQWDGKDGKPFIWNGDDAKMKDLLKEWQSKDGKPFIWNGDDAKMKDLLKEWQSKDGKPFIYEWNNGNGDLKGFFNGKEWKGDASPEKQKEMQKWLKDHGYNGASKDFAPYVITPGKDNPYTFTLGGGSDIKGLMKSITKEQWDLHKKQGYLKFDQLTPSQQKKLGISQDSGKFTVNYSIDGKSLSIRGE